MANSSVGVSGWRMAATAGLMFCTAWSHIQGQRVAASGSTEVKASSARVSIDLENASIRTVVQAIAEQANLRLSYEANVIPGDALVTVRISNVLVDEAFQFALRGTGLVADIKPSGNVWILRKGVAQGTISGKVISAKTKQPIPGATVFVDDALKGISTDQHGVFRIAVGPGEHKVSVRAVGFVRQTKAVSVAEGGSVSTEFALETSTSVLDEVVVAGTVAATERRAIPNAITVITAELIEQRGITRIDQLFRGDVPGLIALNTGSLLGEVVMYSRGATELEDGHTQSYTNHKTNPIKTYVDGIELADPSFLNSIDPKSIERIEILSGPQASTIYGSNAINGVMQIFTKRGTSTRPELTLVLSSATIQNNFSSALAPQHDHSLTLNGVEGRLSYNVGATWLSTGSWNPGIKQRKISWFGGIVAHFGALSIDGNIREARSVNTSNGNSFTQLQDELRAIGWRTPSSVRGISARHRKILESHTHGITLQYKPLRWWSHEVMFGTDQSDNPNYDISPRIWSPSDTLRGLFFYHSSRQSLRYSTTAQIPLGVFAKALFVVGADGWTSFEERNSGKGTTIYGTIPDMSLSRTTGRNRGVFGQAQFGIFDAFFLTYGLRGEWNPAFGEDAQPNYAPRYGLALTRDFGVTTVKLRGSYGRSTRPPEVGLKLEAFQMSATRKAEYGENVPSRLGNPDLRPEVQQGVEIGTELYFGSRGSLVVTWYNQTVDDLTSRLSGIDSVRSILPNPSSASSIYRDSEGHGYAYQEQFVNVGAIRNTGWEVQGGLRIGSLAWKGTYSWTKSRVIGISPKYHDLSVLGRFLYPGQTLRGVPEHNWGTSLMWTRSSTSASLTLSGLGQYVTSGGFNEFVERNLVDVRLPADRPRVVSTGISEWVRDGYAMADVNIAHRLRANLDGTLQCLNLTDFYQNDNDAGSPAIGRQTKIGLRLRW